MTMTNETLRPELTKMPERIRALPVFRGYPVPWFVAYPNGPDQDPDFRVADRGKWIQAVQQKLCWVCGQKLGAHLVFVLGPMCGISRTTSEPACHRECADWSVANCPFLTRPGMRRRDANMPVGSAEAPGLPIDRNPGVTFIWSTRSYKLFRAPDMRYLIHVGDPIEVNCWREGRRATRAEVDESIDGGLPHLMKLAESDGPEAVDDLNRGIAELAFYLPLV